MLFHSCAETSEAPLTVLFILIFFDIVEFDSSSQRVHWPRKFAHHSKEQLDGLQTSYDEGAAALIFVWTVKLDMIKWADDKTVTLVSSCASVSPAGQVRCYSKEEKRKVGGP